MPTQSCCRCYDLLNRTPCEMKSMELLAPEPHQSAEIVVHVDLEDHCTSNQRWLGSIALMQKVWGSQHGTYTPPTPTHTPSSGYHVSHVSVVLVSLPKSCFPEG